MINPTKYYSNIQEHRVADYLDWHVVTGSGATACKPGDIWSDNWLGECKTHVTLKDTLTFNAAVWDKLSCEAQFKFKYPVLIVDDGSQKIENTWCMFSYQSVCPPNTVTAPLTLSSSVNVILPISYARHEYNKIQLENPNKVVVFSVRINNHHVGILPLTKFKELYGE